MRVFLFLLLVSMFLYSCKEASRQSSEQLNSVDTLPKTPLSGKLFDTIKIVKVFVNDTKIFQECYAVVHGKDTSAFRCHLSRSRETGAIGMKLTFSPKMSYRQQMTELAMILPVAKGDFTQLDSLKSISIGRLHSTGDLAIDVTNQYLQQYKKIPSSIINKEIDQFLLTSKLVDDFNSILKPYSVAVTRISTEKDFFADKKYLYSMSKIESDSAKVPSQILDAQIWIGIQVTY